MVLICLDSCQIVINIAISEWRFVIMVFQQEKYGGMDVSVWIPREDQKFELIYRN